MPHLSPEVRAALASVLIASAASAAEPNRVFTLWPARAPAQPATTPELTELGGRVYRGACMGCHGEKGDGLGREGKFLEIPPRDFTIAQFITRSTPLGTLPLDSDLFGSIRRGFVPGKGMPAFTFLSDREVWAVIAYLKTFSPRWKEEKPGTPYEIPPMPERTQAMLDMGRATFMGAGACFLCHGMGGLGDGPVAGGLGYVSGSHKGKKVKPANLSRKQDFKGGDRPEDIYRSITTGLDGTPMPAFPSLTPEQRWQIVAYILSLNKS